MSSSALEFPVEARRYPGRYEVVDATLVRDGERIAVVVKKTPHQFRDRFRGTRAERSYRAATELRARGIATPEPLLAERRGDESWFVARRLEGALQVREWFLHRDDPVRFPAPALPIPLGEVVTALGCFARRMHDAGVFFRDFTDGNILVTDEGGRARLWVVDLTRARIHAGPQSMWPRLRDLARPGINRPDDRKLLLDSYFAPDSSPGSALAFVAGLRRRIVLWDDLKRTLRPWRQSATYPARSE